MKTLEYEVDEFQESVNTAGRVMSQLVQGTTYNKLPPREKELYNNLVKLNEQAKEKLKSAKEAYAEALKSWAELIGQNKKNTATSTRDFINANI